jgi:formylmethanofuran dehydrogenase subunit C
MSGFRLTLRQQPAGRLDMSGVDAARFAGMSAADVERAELSPGLRLKDVFSVAGSSGETLTIAGETGRLDFLGAGLAGGTLVVDGPGGAYAGRGMKGGRIEIKGDAGPFAASGMSGGLLLIGGSAGDNLGGARPGEKFGMAGGIVHVSGNIGARAGDRMRRGTVVAKGTCGPAAGSRMMGGTIWAAGGFGEGPGPLLRRGTLIGPSAQGILPTFADCGRHQLSILAILSRYLADALGPLAPPPIAGPVRRLAGDMATIGKGELLLLS